MISSKFLAALTVMLPVTLAPPSLWAPTVVLSMMPPSSGAS